MAQAFRPFSANPSVKKLGSTCPIIIKHDFPNEDQNYLDEGLITLNSYKKRFRYDDSNNIIQRPVSAFMSSPHQMKQIKIRASSSKNWHPSSKAEFLSSVMKSIKNREKNEIKPLRKLKTMYFHSILYKVKQQKEELDEKIRVMDNLKTDFKETDICILANTGAIDYILNLNAKANPTSCSSQLLKNERKEIQEIKETKKILSQSHRPNSSHPIFYNPKKNVEKKPEILNNEDFYDEKNEEFHILGNASKMFSRPLSSVNPSKNEITDKINVLIEKSSRIKELYDSENQQQFLAKETPLIEIPEVEDIYKVSKTLQQDSTQQNTSFPLKNPYKTTINIRVKPQKLYKTSLTKFQEAGLTNSSMRVRAVELLNCTPRSNPYNQIHSAKQAKFFERQQNKNHEEVELMRAESEKNLGGELSITGFSNKMIKIKNLNENMLFEGENYEHKEEEQRNFKNHRPMTAMHRPTTAFSRQKGMAQKIVESKENQEIKPFNKNLIVDGSVFNMFSNVNIKQSLKVRPKTAVGAPKQIKK